MKSKIETQIEKLRDLLSKTTPELVEVADYIYGKGAQNGVIVSVRFPKLNNASRFRGQALLSLLHEIQRDATKGGQKNGQK